MRFSMSNDNVTRIFIISCLNHSPLPLSLSLFQYFLISSLCIVPRQTPFSSSLHISNKPKFSSSNRLCITFSIVTNLLSCIWKNNLVAFFINYYSLGPFNLNNYLFFIYLCCKKKLRNFNDDITGIIFHFSLSSFISRIQLMKFGRYVQGERIVYRSEKLVREWVARVAFWNV